MTRVSGQAFIDTVLGFQHTAFRLEVRDRYNEPSEQEVMRRFLAGEGLDESYMNDWIDELSPRIAGGQRMERVRVVSYPHSEYTRFGLALAKCNVEAGEDIRYLRRDRAIQLGLPDHDFWLLDSSTLAVLKFDEDDVLLGADVTNDPATVVQSCFWRDVARHYATPWARYAER